MRSKARDKSFQAISNSAGSSGRVRRLMLPVIVFLQATVFVLVSCSTPEGQKSGQSTAAQSSEAMDWKAVERALGKAGSMQPGDVYKVSLPRSER